MITIHFYEKVFKTPRKEQTYESFFSYIKKSLNLDNPQNYFYEYLTKIDDNSEGIYCLLNKNTFNQFLDDNVTDIFIYRSLEETKNYKDNNKEEEMQEKDEQEEENPNFYEDDNIEENNIIDINNIQEDNYLKEKIKQTIINQQKQKIREERLKQERAKKERIKQQNELKISNLQNANNKINIMNNLDNDIDNQEIINIIDQNFEKFRENLINESKVQTSKILMESKLKLQEDNDNENDIETPSSVEIHNGSVCNGCGDFPIIGIRYKCVECKDFDFCEKCHAENKFIHKHPFYKLRFIIQ